MQIDTSRRVRGYRARTVSTRSPAMGRVGRLSPPVTTTVSGADTSSAVPSTGTGIPVELCAGPPVGEM